jgi:iron complex outermembrane receptor protein
MSSYDRVRTRGFWPAALFIALLASPATAQVLMASAGDPQNLKQLSLQELSQIEVTTLSKEPQQASHTAAAIFVITGEDIRRSGVTTIPEALRLAPGIEVARIDSDKWSIGIRGFGSRLSRSVLVLIDGRTVYTTLLAGTYWEVQDTTLEDIDRIEVIRGPGGTIWGPNAVNGVINIITRHTRETHGALISAGAGNLDQGFLNARFGGGNEKLSYRVYGKGFSRNHEFHPDHRNFDDWRGGQGGFRLDWNKDEKNTITISGDLYAQRDGESVVATSYTPPYSRTIDDNARLSGGNVLARWTRSFGEGNDIQLQGYYDRTNRREPNFEDLRDTFDIDLVQHWKMRWRQTLTWGVGARWSRGDDIEVVSGLTFLPAQRTDQLFTGFVQDEINLVENRLTLTVGTKLLHTNFATFEPEPSVRVMYMPTKSTSIWAAATHAVRTPSDAEHDFFLSGFIATAPDGTPFFARFNANRDFKPEQLNGFELGFRQLIGKSFFIDVATFYNHYSDLFSQEITGPVFLEQTPPPEHLLLPARFGNGLKGITKGIEISPEVRIHDFWRLRGSYSYLHMNIDKTPGSLDIGSAPGVVGSSPNHQVSIVSSFDMTKRLSLDLTYRYVSDLPAQMVAAYHTGDVRFGWRITQSLAADLVGQNLFQPYHSEFGTDPGPLVGIRRSGYLKLTWTR